MPSLKYILISTYRFELKIFQQKRSCIGSEFGGSREP